MNSYSPNILNHFEKPQHAGRLTSDTVYSAMLGTPSQGAVVNIDIVIANGNISQAAFMAYGDPALIAAADYVCAQLTGKPISFLSELTAKMIVNGLQLPRELFSRAVLVEDTLQAVLAKIDNQ